MNKKFGAKQKKQKVDDDENENKHLRLSTCSDDTGTHGDMIVELSDRTPSSKGDMQLLPTKASSHDEEPTLDYANQNLPPMYVDI